MGKLLKTKKQKIIAILLSCIIAVGAGVGGFFAYKALFPPKSIKYDLATGSTVKERVDSAQYLPNIERLASPEVQNNGVSSTSLNSTETAEIKFNLNDYTEIVNDLAIITGTATQNDKSILDIKEEISTVLEMAPAFGKWFQLPTYKQAEHGQDGYNNFYYKFEYNHETQQIAVTRMTWSYTASVYVSSEDKVYSTYFNDDVKQYQIMQASYYFTNTNKEVVECSIVDFMKFNNDFYPIQCQYLKNIEDTSTTKIQSVLRKELTLYNDKIVNENVSRAYDIDTIINNGVMTKIVQLDYTDPYNIELIKIEQNSATNYYSNSNSTNLAYYLKQTHDTVYYTNSWDYYDLTNSTDNIPLNNIFELRETSKQAVLESFKQSEYCTRQVTGTFNTSSAIVCTDCYNHAISSGLMVYKCNHNKNQDTVARATANAIVSSEEYGNKILKFIPWHISNHLAKFVNTLNITHFSADSLTSDVCIDMMANNYNFQTAIDTLIAFTTQSFINTKSLCGSIKDLYNTIQSEYIPLQKSQLNRKDIKTELELKNFDALAVIQKTIIKVKASATVKSNKYMNIGDMYSLSLVMYNSKNNSIYTLISNYVEYTGSTLDLTLEGQYNLKAFALTTKDANLNNDLNFECVYALTKRTPNGDVLCSKTHEAKFNDVVLTTFETESNGYICSFTPDLSDGHLTMTTNFVDSENPVISIKGIQQTSLILPTGSTLADLFKITNISDNDMAENLTVLYGTTEYSSFDQPLVAGENTISVMDRTGNLQEFKFTLDFSII